MKRTLKSKVRSPTCVGFCTPPSRWQHVCGGVAMGSGNQASPYSYWLWQELVASLLWVTHMTKPLS